MTKPGGSLTTKKPPYTNVDWKTLDDPEKFRDADRIEEAASVPQEKATRPYSTASFRHNRGEALLFRFVQAAI